MRRSIPALALLAAMFWGATAAHADTYTCSNVPTSVSGDTTIDVSGGCNIDHDVVVNGGKLMFTGFGDISAQGISADSITLTALTNTVTFTGTVHANNDINITGGVLSTITLQDVTSDNSDINLQSSNSFNLNGLVNAPQGTVKISGGTINAEDDIKGYFVEIGGTSFDGKDIHAKSGVNITEGQDHIKVQKIDANEADVGGNVYIESAGPLATDSITINGSATTGFIEIHPNDTNDAFEIGGSGSSNGVNGVLNASTDSAGGSEEQELKHGIYVALPSGSTNGITLDSMSSLLVAGNSSRSGLIALDAADGILSLPGGTMDATGQSGGGLIYLMANEIDLADGAIIDASQPASAAPTNHGVSIGAESVFALGDVTLSANGAGRWVAEYGAGVGIGPVGTVTITTSGDYKTRSYYFQTTGTFTTDSDVNVYGETLNINANGEADGISLGGHPLRFLNSVLNLSAKGPGTIDGGNPTNGIYIGYLNATSPAFAGIEFSGDTSVSMDVSGQNAGDNGGYVNINSDGIWTLVPSFEIHADGNGSGQAGQIRILPLEQDFWSSNSVISANGRTGLVNISAAPDNNGSISIQGNTFSVTTNGPSSGDGDAGTIDFNTSSWTLDSSTKMLLSGNGPSAGTGNGAPDIHFDPGNADIKLGTNNGDVQILANGGQMGGDGGSITVSPDAGNVTFDTGNGINANAPGTNGKGGIIKVNAAEFANKSTASSSINADGNGTGDGGEIHLIGNGTLALNDSGAGALALSAKSEGTGNGGTIEVGYLDTLTIDGTLSVSAGTTGSGDGNGGTLNLHDNGSLTVTATIDASANGSGTGGTVTLDSLGTDITTATIVASGGSNDGDGGTVNVTDLTGRVDWHTVVNVDSGGDVGGCCTAAIATSKLSSGFNGYLTVKNSNTGLVTTCRQWLLNPPGVWPGSYWDCTANHDSPTTLDRVPGSLAAGAKFNNLASLLNGKHTEIYVFAGAADYNNVQVDNQVSTAGGVTYSEGKSIYVNPWESGSVGANATVSYTTTNYPEVAAHEFGHAVDIAIGKAVDSMSPNYNTWLVRDANTLDYADDAFTVKRLPCAKTQIPGQPAGTYYAGQIPFANVIDVTSGDSICSGSSLNPALGFSSSVYNSQILSTLDEGLWVASGNAPAWVESHAQLFAYNMVGNLGARAMDDKVFDHGYFPCLKSWANTEQTSAAVPTGACTLSPQ